MTDNEITKELYALKAEVRALENLMKEKQNALKELIDAKLIASSLALEKFSVANNERLKSMNEFRNALKDQTSAFITRTEVELKNRHLEDGMNLLSKKTAQSEGRASQTAVFVAIVLALIGIVIGVIQIFVK